MEGYSNVDGQPRLRASDGESPPNEPSTSRTKMYVAVAVLGVVALGATSLIAGRSDSGTATSTETTTATVVETSAPPTTTVQLEPAVTEPPSTTAETPPDDPFAETDPESAALDAVWTGGQFTSPAALLGADPPTTVVTLDGDGVLRELDMATGRLVKIQIGSTPAQSQVVVGRSSTLVSVRRGPAGAGAAALYRVGEPSIEVEGDSGQANFAARPNSDGFTGFGFGFGDDSNEFFDLAVTASGVLEQTPANLEDGAPWLRRFGPNGNALFEDGGSVFEVQPDDAITLLTSGELLATSSHHVLVRECDDAHECTTLLIDGAQGERRIVTVGPEFDAAFLADTAQVSPDGSKLWFPRFDQDSTEYIMDLETGAAVEIGANPGSFGTEFSAPGYIWTADSSGVIRSTFNALEFVDAATGVRTEFGGEFAGEIAFGVRLDLSGVPSPPPSEPTDTGIQIAGYGDGVVHRIDIDSGEIISVEATPIGSSAPVFVMSDSNGVSVVAYDNVDGIRVEGDVATPITDDPFGGLMLAGPRPDTLWVPGDRSSGTYELYDSLGQPTGDIILLPEFAASASGADGAGGIVSLSTLGGAYALDPTGVERITTGELLALGPTAAVAEECDEAYNCGVVIIDRLTGDRSPFEDPVLAASLAEPPSRAFLTGHAVAPSADVALLYEQVSHGFVFVELDTGRATTAPPPDPQSIVVWSDDGRAAVYLSDGRLQIFDRATSSVRALEGVPPLRSFAALAE